MTRAAILALALAGCGNLTEQTRELGACAESTREWWPVKTDARWVYRITNRKYLVDNPSNPLPPLVGWKEHRIMGVAVEIGGLAGDERGIRMRSIDELDAEWDYSHFVERDGAYRWVSKRIYAAFELPPPFPLDDEVPSQERLYVPPRTRLDYSGAELCAHTDWHEEWEAFKYELHDPPLPPQLEPDTRPCLVSTWEEDAWACDPATVREESNWEVLAVDATVALFNGRVFYEGALCLKRVDRNPDGSFPNDSLYCWVRGVGKVLECEVDHFNREVVKVEELCLFCPPGEDCEWTTEEAYEDRVPAPPLCHELCLSCPEGEDCEWSEDDHTPPPDCALTDNWEAKRCEDAIIY